MIAGATAVLVAGCASTEAGVDATGSPLPTGTTLPEKQVPLVAPSGEATADAQEGSSVQANPSASPEVAGVQDGADAGAAEENQDERSLDERAEAIARDIFDLANAARATEDEAALEWTDCAADQAVERAEEALTKDELEHEKLEFDCTASVVGENLVRGDGPARALHQLWIDSESHRENIMNDDFEKLGVGCVAHAVGDRTEPAADAASIGGWVCSQMFYG
ncbi:hypothetical protein Dac01nite_05490 [Demequina activiva]|uniref:SCP domain-containing protein n=1 Tax=Demequina activiva TaxID=1582364 RepID=A0A919Q0E3_9MICO|nr:hypothetical protein Dac01nite_05490 [Demequina activiva]